jgi:sulfur carrier protein ThiS
VEIIYNGAPRQVAEGASLAELLASVELPTRERLAEHSLRPGDRVEVVTLAGGG